MSLVLNCVRCGHEMPPLSEEEKQAFYAAGGRAVAQHPFGQCPGETPEPEQRGPRQRVFEAYVSIREVFPGEERNEELTSFVASAQAPSAVAVMEAGGDLAQAMGEKWMRAAEHIGLADVPVEPREG